MGPRSELALATAGRHTDGLANAGDGRRRIRRRHGDTRDGEDHLAFVYGDERVACGT